MKVLIFNKFVFANYLTIEIVKATQHNLHLTSPCGGFFYPWNKTKIAKLLSIDILHTKFKIIVYINKLKNNVTINIKAVIHNYKIQTSTRPINELLKL